MVTILIKLNIIITESADKSIWFFKTTQTSLYIKSFVVCGYSFSGFSVVTCLLGNYIAFTQQNATRYIAVFFKNFVNILSQKKGRLENFLFQTNVLQITKFKKNGRMSRLLEVSCLHISMPFSLITSFDVIIVNR